MASRLLTALCASMIAGCSTDGAGMAAGMGGRGGAPPGSGGEVSAAGSGGAAAGVGGRSASGGGGAGGAAGAGSGGTAGGGWGGDHAAAPACAALSQALCRKIEICTPFAVGLVFGSRSVCEQRLTLDCLPKFAAPGSAATPALTSSCADSLAAHPCAAFLRGDFGAACAPLSGRLQGGAACGDDAQCASTFCARARDAVCGVCATTTPAGSPCVRDSCSAGTVCPMGKSTCVVPEPGQVGAACTVHEQCDIGNGIGCNPLTGRCIRLALGSDTGTCGLDLAGALYTACPASGTCSAPLGGKCTAGAADGAACSTGSAGPGCLPPARCVGGRCTLPDPSACSP
jgi:hypothetical protein